MGQRLNIEVVGIDGTPLANAYYHWGAYTMTALEMVMECVSRYHALKSKEPDSLLLAVEMLSATDAGFKDGCDLAVMNEKYPYYQNKKDADGIISVTEGSMENTRYNMEHCAIIRLDKETVEFDVLYLCKDEDDIINVMDDYGGSDVDTFKASLKDIGVCSYEPNEIPFDRLQEFYDKMQDAENNGYVFKWGENIYKIYD